MEKRKIELLMSVVLILCACVLAGKGWEQAASRSIEKDRGKKLVIVDAGHGGCR